MRIAGKKILDEFAQRHPNTKSALYRWYDLMKQGTFHSFASLREMFPSVNQVKVSRKRFGAAHQETIVTVFNIGGNKVRLIASIEYDARQSVTIDDVMTHEKYDRGRWKE